MTTITFDTLQFVKNLQAKGFAAEQAEGISEALKDVMTVAEVTTKHDLKELENKLDIRIAEIKAEIANARTEIIKWNIGAIIAAVGLFATITKIMGTG